MQELTSNRYEIIYPKTAIDLVEGYQEDWKIGDCRLTLKKDLRENWHLCDGTEFSADEYPDLRNIVGVDVTTQWNEKKEIIDQAYTTDSVYIQYPMISNGKSFFKCSKGLYFSDVPDGSYQKISFFLSQQKVNGISYLAPYWYALVVEDNKYNIYKTTTLTGSWDKLSFSLNTGYYSDGYYVSMTSMNGEIVLYGGQDGQYKKTNLLWIKDDTDNFNKLVINNVFSQRRIEYLFYANRFYYMEASGTGGPVYSTSLTGSWTLINDLKRGNLYYDGESVWGINNNNEVVRMITPTSKVVYSGVGSISGVVRLSDGYGILINQNGKFSFYLAKDQSTIFNLGLECVVDYQSNSDYYSFSRWYEYTEKNGVVYIMQSTSKTYYDTPTKYGYSFHVYSIGGHLPNIAIAGVNVYIKMRD